MTVIFADKARKEFLKLDIPIQKESIDIYRGDFK